MRSKCWSRAGLSAFALILLTGCGDNRQSTLSPDSPPAHDIRNLWWGTLAAAAIVFAGTLFLILLSRVRRERRDFPFVGDDEKRLNGLIVAFGIVIPVLALTALFYIADVGVLRATDAPAKGETKMTIQVIGRQWFWEVRYPGGAVTANEIHIPVRTPVKVVLTTADVIHSFWVPELNKKVDTVPGHPNPLLLYADKPGVYRGQCAEFCGLQHAKMAMAVYADPPARFRAWLANESKPLAASAQQSSGFQAFTDNQCASCHTLRGTSARGRIGPDLTHLMGRKTLGALTIPNTRKYLGAWVLDPQRFKPGNRMPALQLKGPEFAQLMNFLRSLR
ncbi:MAG TPA: cytochrome c oxidase subunit II [Thermoleophilaceae bacterium]|nr:cytochrome c oxidase subunit II [Thermoleophilaceae bacterium]